MKRVLRRVMLVAVSAVLALLAVAFIFILPARRLTVEQVPVHLPHWPAGGAPARIAVLSDLHAGRYDGAWVDAIVQRTLALQPQAILLLGDYFNALHHGSGMPPQELARRLAPLVARCPVYFVCGNHDRGRRGFQLRRELTALGMVNLEGKDRELRFPNGQSLVLRGAAFCMETSGKEPFYVKRTLQKRFSRGALPQDKPLLAACHSPFYFLRRPLWADVTVAGHTHGGQVCMPGGYPLASLPYWSPSHTRSGLKTGAAGTPLYISRGLGLSQLPFRAFCPPEITLLLLLGKGA